jgi:hypothetical protein
MGMAPSMKKINVNRPEAVADKSSRPVASDLYAEASFTNPKCGFNEGKIENPSKLRFFASPLPVKNEIGAPT